MAYPILIQGGMGVAVSSWPLARAVSQLGQLGVVSGTMLSVVQARRLQLGDPGGHLRRALANFPIAEMATRVLDRYFVPEGKAAAAPFASAPMPSADGAEALTELTVVASFAEVFLAKEGHDGVVGMNLLEKIQLPTLASLWGAMLAGVDYVLMGAGIPRTIPGALDQLARGERAELSLDVAGEAPGAEPVKFSFDPKAYLTPGVTPPAVPRPQFLAIVSSATLALTLAKKSTGRVDGFVVEGELAGGHNAPPRGPLQLSPEGEPVYGARDVPDLEKIRALGLPFWLAGAYAEPGKLAAARAAGAAGVQVGTAFAFCEESGVTPELKARARATVRAGTAKVFTDPFASPTGFPFKVFAAEGTVSDPAVYAARERVCDLGYLRQAYRKPDGALGFRCAAEPVEAFVRKGGAAEDAVGRKCLCNGLLATVGLGQAHGERSEPAIVTAGNDVAGLARFMPPDRDAYTAADVVRVILGAS